MKERGGKNRKEDDRKSHHQEEKRGTGTECESLGLPQTEETRVMAQNHTNMILEMLQSFDAVPLIIAFCVSMAVGLLLGALVYVILTWMSRRRAGSASITRHPPRHSSTRTRPNFNRNSSYDRRSNNSLVTAAFTFHRQTSSNDPLDPLGHKSSFRASTFHPLLHCSQIAREAEEGSQITLPRTPPLTTSAGSAQPGAAPQRPESFWGNNALKGFQATQTPPPAYESIIRAYQETRT